MGQEFISTVTTTIKSADIKKVKSVCRIYGEQLKQKLDHISKTI
jgi:hypothetical protein